ncbi:uncharacterized protein [Clytia hemisphaerica]|uniref:Myb/SANT-like DNA-binding domain-containing protein n=1 Tax=Clytia hemisphaerica TaxID=252671 RepID=A0A7M5XJT5_9CNID
MNDEENEYDGGSSGESENESESENDCEGGETVNVTGKKSNKAKGYNWSEGLTLQLIDTYVKYKERFSEGNPATKVWERFIVRDLHLTIPRGVKLPSKQQCITRWNSMLRTYNKAIHQNNVSGNRRRKLPYYHENLHEAVKKEPKITPKYLASTNSITTQNPNLSSSSSSSASINTSRSNEGDEKRKYRSSTDIMMARMEKWKQEMEAREMAREQAIEARFQRLEALAERKISVLERIEKKL